MVRDTFLLVKLTSVDGLAHLFGRVPGIGPVSKKGIVPHDAPMHVSPRNVGLGDDVKWVGGAAGRSHWFLLDSKGGVWGSGNNVVGQLGLVSCSLRV